MRQRVIRQLKYVADSPDECEDRRIVASFEYAIMILCYPDIYESDTSLLPTALQYLHYAATSGYQAAQGIDSQMHNIFGYKYPLSPSVEIEKLVQASLGGSLTAMMRLRRLSPTRYSETHRLIPFGHNESSVKCELRREIEPILKVIRTGVIDPPSLLIHQLVKLGQLENLKSLSDLSVRYFNEKNSLGETPLLVACQYGYADIVALLLALGADPSMGTYSHVHPLHFLGAFDDKDIPEVAALLVQHGASLEAHSREGKIYHKGIDSQFGMEEGTPLLWAVHAANFVAIETLLQLGADIFAYKQVQQWSFSDDTIIHPSPLEQAICSYRYDMVELLLTSCSRPEILSRKLNQLRLVGRDLEMTPLFLALHRRTLSTLTATVVHGRQIKLAQLKTVETLLRYGADPLKLTREADGSSLSPMVVVCQHDNLPLLHFLWQYGGGILRPSSGRVFFQSILYAMQQSNKDMFNFLVTEQHHMNALDDMHVWGMRALEKACDVSDIHYLSALITNMPRKVLSSSSSSSSSGIERRPDLTKQLIIALSAANLEAAYLFSQHGHCDLTQQMDGSSLLSFFIMFDANHPIAKNRVGTILSLAASFDSPLYKDWLFWNCQELGGTQLTALHFAFLRQKFEITGELMVPAEINKIILSNLIQYFHEPDMLNAKIDSRSAQYAGDTAFHLAAREGCMTAIRTLLESTYSVGSIDLNILNAYNQSPTDLFIMYYENLFNDLKDGLLRSGSLSTEWSLTRKLDEAENILFRLLHDHNCRISVFCLTAVRLSDDSFMFVRRPNTIINASYTNGTLHSLPLPHLFPIVQAKEKERKRI